MSDWTPEDSYKAFKEKRPIFEGFNIESNEAQTRLELIDTMLFDVLDWEKSEVEVEKYCREPGYADYVFKVGGKLPLVVEAKRAGKNFFVAPGKTTLGRPVPFALLAAESKDAKAALTQALMYATTLGTQFIGITNGTQWLFTITFVEGQAVDDRQVYVFDSVESIDQNFRLFYDCFARSGVESNRVVENLLEKRAKPATRKLSSEIANYPQNADRNYYANELSFVLNKLWDILSSSEHSEDFIRHCYVTAPYNSQVARYAKEILKVRAETDYEFSVGEVEGSSGIRNAIQTGMTDKPFIILGEVGRGKSSFLDNLRFVQGKDEFNRYIQLEIDFLDRPDFSSEVTDFVYEEIESILLNSFDIDIHENSMVRGVLHNELKRFRKSAKWESARGDADKENDLEIKFIEEKISSRHKYFKDLIRHLKRGQKKSIAIFFDNLDRRNSEIQEEAFLKASAIARDWGCAVFVCLRPETFHDSMRRGVLDSVAPKTFTIAEPDLSLVLKRRFEYAKKIVMSEVGDPVLDEFARNVKVGLKLPSVAEILEGCELSARKKSSAITMLSALSNGNIRQLIDLAKKILTSGLLDTSKISRVIKASGSYTIPDYEALKALLFGDYRQFDPRSSVFINLFDVFTADQKEHFFRMLALEYLSRFDESSDNEGFVPAEDLKVYLQSYYFTSEVYIKHIKALVDKRCIAVQDFKGADGEARPTYRIRSRGRFHLYDMTASFVYYDAMIVDTPIGDPVLRKEMNGAENIEDRLPRAEKFLSYLEESAKSLHDASGRDLVLEFLSKARLDIANVKQRVEEASKASKKR